MRVENCVDIEKNVEGKQEDVEGEETGLELRRRMWRLKRMLKVLEEVGEVT